MEAQDSLADIYEKLEPHSVEDYLDMDDTTDCFGEKENDVDNSERIPLELLLSSIKKTARLEGESDEQFLGKITHINLSGKGLKRIKGLELCRKMQTLYFYENALEVLSPLSFARGLTHIYLQHNNLHSLNGIGELPCLQKLYADYNFIECVSDLEGCSSLSELHLSHQRLPDSKGLYFTQETMGVMRECLVSLSVRGCRLARLSDLGQFSSLENFDGSDGDVSGIEELETTLGCLPNLAILNLVGCPVTKARKYRDRMVLAGLNIINLDGKPVRDDERLFLIKMKKNTLKKRMASMK